MKSKYFLIVTYLLLITSNGCDTTEPPPPDGNNNLEYNWEIDTLRNPNGYGVVPWACWGSSPQSVWIAGFNLAGQGEIFNWDGIEWNRVTPDLGFNYEVVSIFGFSENEVYAAGSKLIADTVLHTEALILKYNGISWQTENLPFGKGIKFIHGRNSGEIWACGYYGSLYHKSGVAWEKTIFDEKMNLGPIYVAPNGKVFMMSFPSTNPPPGDSAMHYFWEYTNQNWEIIDSNSIYNDNYELVGYTFGNRAMWGLSDNNIYSVGNRGLFRFNGTNWNLSTWDDYLYRDIKGTQENRMFVVGDHGTIRYSEGSNWIRIGDYSSYIVDFYSVMPFKDEIFIGAYQLGVGYVVHGKLKNN